MKCWSAIASLASRRWNRIGVEMLYGRLPTTRSVLPRRGRGSAAKSTSSTSASITSRPGVRRSRAARSRSSSITVSRSQRSSSGQVSAPRPGPISTSAWPGRGSIASTIRSITVDRPGNAGRSASLRRQAPRRRDVRAATAAARASRCRRGRAGRAAIRRRRPRTSARAGCCAPARAAAGCRASSGAGRRPGSDARRSAS